MAQFKAFVSLLSFLSFLSWLTLAVGNPSDATRRQAFITAMQRVEEKKIHHAQDRELELELLKAAIRVTPSIRKHLDEGRELDYNAQNYGGYYEGKNGYNQGNGYGAYGGGGGYNQGNGGGAYNQGNNMQYNGGNNNQYNKENGGNNNQYNHNQNQGNRNYNNMVNNYANKYYGNQNHQANQGDMYMYYDDLDLSNLAFKYVGCQNIATWSDYRVHAGLSPTALKRYVIFRLCDSRSCSTYNKYGCNNNYGEYILPMESYLSITTTYHYKQYSRYCQVCDACQKFDFSLYLNQVAAYQTYVNKRNRNNYNNNGKNGNYQAYNANNYNNYNDDAGGNGLDDVYAADDTNFNGDDGGNVQYNQGDDGTTDDYHQYMTDYYSNQNSQGDDNYVNRYGSNGYDFADDQISTFVGNDDGASNQAGNNNWNQYSWSGGDNSNGYWYGGRRDLQYSNGYGGGNNIYNQDFGHYQQGGYYGEGVPSPELPFYINDDGSCKFESVCKNFKSACRSFHPNATNYQPYFSCSKYAVGNDVSYVGPHCRSDGHTIGIGIYQDEYCSTYIGDVVNIEKYTGKKFDDREMSIFYDKSCISCKASESYSLVPTSSSSLNDDEEEPEPTYPFCAVAYQKSAKCNTNFKSNNPLYEDGSEEVDKVCPFADSLIENNYNELGEIHVEEGFHFSKLNSGSEYISLARRASPVQMVMLVTSMSTALGLLIYAFHLQKKLVFRVPWRPPKSVTSPTSGGTSAAGDYDFDTRSEAGKISRINSGITALRSPVSVDGQTVGFGRFGPVNSVGSNIVHGDLTYNARPAMSSDYDFSAPSDGQFA